MPSSHGLCYMLNEYFLCHQRSQHNKTHFTLLTFGYGLRVTCCCGLGPVFYCYASRIGDGGRRTEDGEKTESKKLVNCQSNADSNFKFKSHRLVQNFTCRRVVGRTNADDDDAECRRDLLHLCQMPTSTIATKH